MRTTSKRVEMQDVLDTFHDAISSLPKKKDSRADPIFEPHFKLVSIVHKLVLRGDMSVSLNSRVYQIQDLTPSKPTEASQALQVTPWARKVEAPEDIDGWKPYILDVIRKFKTADKSNWHHRMSAKVNHSFHSFTILTFVLTEFRLPTSSMMTKRMPQPPSRPSKSFHRFSPRRLRFRSGDRNLNVPGGISCIPTVTCTSS
jgi:hypothetical protein